KFLYSGYLGTSFLLGLGLFSLTPLAFSNPYFHAALIYGMFFYTVWNAAQTYFENSEAALAMTVKEVLFLLAILSIHFLPLTLPTFPPFEYHKSFPSPSPSP